jgi:hypothetical protein
MQASSTIMLTGSANFIIISSQRRVNGLDTAPPLPPPVAWGTIVSMGIFLTIAMLIYARSPKRKQNSSKVRLPLTITCSRCRYFNDNHYLKCALHPVTVMTEEAVECKDYCQKVRAKWIENFEQY